MQPAFRVAAGDSKLFCVIVWYKLDYRSTRRSPFLDGDSGGHEIAGQAPDGARDLH